MIRKMFLLITLLISSYSYSQNILRAGNYLTNNYYHVTFNPIKILKDNMFDSLDIDGDNMFDIKIIMHDRECDDRPPFCYNERSTFLTLRDSSVEIAYSNGIKILSSNDSLTNPSQNWIDYNYGYLTVNVPDANINNDNWIGKDNKYIGFRLIRGQDTLYAWLKLSVKDYDYIEIQETYCESHGARDTIITSSSTKISEPNFSKIELYPNPTQDYLYVKGIDKLDYNLLVYNVLGQPILKIDKILNPINISTLIPGIYYLRIKLGDKVIEKAIIKK